MFQSAAKKATELYEAAVAAGNAGEFDRSATLCRQAIALAPDRGHFHAELANAITLRHDYWLNPELCARMIADGRLEEAIRAWSRAFELGHNSHWTRFCMGHALTALGRPSEGAPHLRIATDLRVRKLRPDLPASYETAPVRGPDFLIIGSTKCGTTSLYEYMCRHPQILPAIWKEPEYFRFPERGIDWYLGHMPRIPPGPTRYLTGEASSCYLSIWNCKSLVRAAFPDARLIALVRDPVDKAISHCHHDRKLGCELRSVDEALNHELDILEKIERPWCDVDDYWRTERGYVWLGLYTYLFENWLLEFPREQLLVIPSEDLWERPEPTMTRVFAHVGVNDHKFANYEVHLEGRYDKSKPEPVRERLKQYYRQHNERLFDLLGERLDWQMP
jgi:tetratricopeptide (TPR) repeat protein